GTTPEVPAGGPRYDLVTLDGPASGHTATMLRIPQAITEAMPKGPLARDAVAMNALFRDPTCTAFVIVTLAEDLPARETSELARITRDSLSLPLGPLVVNGLPPEAPARAEVQAVLAAAGTTGDAALDA